MQRLCCGSALRPDGAGGVCALTRSRRAADAHAHPALKSVPLLGRSTQAKQCCSDLPCTTTRAVTLDHDGHGHFVTGLDVCRATVCEYECAERSHKFFGETLHVCVWQVAGCRAGL